MVGIRARPWPPVFPEPEEPEGRARGQQWEDHRAAGAAGVKLPGPGGLNAQDIPCHDLRRLEELIWVHIACLWKETPHQAEQAKAAPQHPGFHPHIKLLQGHWARV